MKISKLQNPKKYIGLYSVDFGEYSATGYTASEVAALLESETFADVKVYKIHRALPDGTVELNGVAKETFNKESGMFFWSDTEEKTRADFDKLIKLAVETAPPGRAKVQLSKYSEEEFVLALIYPAEYEDEFSRWLLDADFRTAGATTGGFSEVSSYYSQKPMALESRQLFGAGAIESRTIDQILADIKKPLQRKLG